MFHQLCFKVTACIEVMQLCLLVSAQACLIYCIVTENWNNKKLLLKFEAKILLVVSLVCNLRVVPLHHGVGLRDGDVLLRVEADGVRDDRRDQRELDRAGVNDANNVTDPGVAR